MKLLVSEKWSYSFFHIILLGVMNVALNWRLKDIVYYIFLPWSDCSMFLFIINKILNESILHELFLEIICI